ncbi:MAG TPA: serpin family protein, partial [Myxococcota bacterium]
IDSELQLKEALEDRGVAAVFDAETCDLTGLNSEEPLFVSGAFHKAFVGVDDKGVEAAAATAIVVDAETSAPSPVTVVVDRPFTFTITDRALRTPLFVGRVERP